MIIAFSGLDGAGKTTQAEKLKKMLKEEKESPVYIHWLSSYSSWINSTKKAVSHSKKQNGSKSNLFKLTARFFLFIFNTIYLSFKIKYYELRGRVVILDRCYVDELIHLRYKGLNEKLYSFFLKITSSLGNVIYLEIIPEEALQRDQKEHKESYYLEKYKLYQEVAERLSDKIEVVKVRKPEVTFQKITQII